MQVTPHDLPDRANPALFPMEGTAFRDTVSWTKLIFADGTAVWSRARRASDHVFHPVMMKNLIICVLVLAVLQNRPDLAQLEMWQFALSWFVVTIAAVCWFYISIGTAIGLERAGRVRFVFTPLLSLPVIPVTEVVRQVTLHLITGQALPEIADIAPFVTRDLIVILLFDIQYGSFVAPHHPLYRQDDPRLAEAAPVHPATPRPDMEALAARPAEMPPVAPQVAMRGETDLGLDEAVALSLPQDGDAARAPDVVAVADGTVEIAGESLKVSELLVIHAEDHYVRVHQTGRSALLRGRFSDVIASVPPDSGIVLNRSVWVSVAGIRALHRTEDYKLLIRAADDQVYTVARSRKSEVQHFARRHGLSLARRKLVDRSAD